MHMHTLTLRERIKINKTIANIRLADRVTIRIDVTEKKINELEEQAKEKQQNTHPQEEQGDVEIEVQERIKAEWGRSDILEVNC